LYFGKHAIEALVKSSERIKGTFVNELKKIALSDLELSWDPKSMDPGSH
jgi:hypothetical protein